MKYPKIKSVKVITNYTLEILFENGIKKLYDCSPLLSDDNFKILNDKAFFNNVEVDIFGFGIIWNKDVDLSESELWINGISVN